MSNAMEFLHEASLRGHALWWGDRPRERHRWVRRRLARTLAPPGVGLGNTPSHSRPRPLMAAEQFQVEQESLREPGHRSRSCETAEGGVRGRIRAFISAATRGLRAIPVPR